MKEPRFLNFNLFQTGALLIGIPIILEIIFVAVLFGMISQVETQAQQIEHSRQMRIATDNVLNSYSRASLALLEYAYEQDAEARERHNAFMDRGARSIKQLHDLCAGEKELQVPLEKIEKLCNAISSRMHTSRQKVDEWIRTDSGNVTTLQQLTMYRERIYVMNGLKVLGHQLTSFAQLADKTSVGPEEAQVARARLKQALAAGIVLQVLAALCLAAFFGGKVLRRIATVKDNTMRLASGRQLNPTLAGEDEIAELDQVFHHMANELAEAARKERAIIDSARDVICTLDSGGRIISANPAASESWGYTRDELVGLRLTEITHGEDVERTHELIDKIVVDQTSGTFECRLTHKDGSEVYTLWSVRWSSLDKVLFCVVHDISERKKLERLRQNFLAMVSHDLRTPLNSVKNFLVILDTPIYGELSEKGLHRKESIEEEVERLQRLVDDILDMEKIESGKLALEFKETSLSRVLERSLEAVRGVSENKGIDISLPKEDFKVVVDEERIIQVVVNFLSNAVKFSPEKSEIKLKADQVNDFVQVSVIDNGCGLPPGAETSIFSRFKQFTTGEKARQGTGLGLAISKEIITAHNGQIGVESIEGRGSTFWFKLPLNGGPPVSDNDHKNAAN